MPVLKTRIHELRKERKMQQSDLAELVGVRRETIGNLENGKYNPSLKLAMDIARVFDNRWNMFFSLRKKRSKFILRIQQTQTPVTSWPTPAYDRSFIIPYTSLYLHHNHR